MRTEPGRYPGARTRLQDLPMIITPTDNYTSSISEYYAATEKETKMTRSVLRRANKI